MTPTASHPTEPAVRAGAGPRSTRIAAWLDRALTACLFAFAFCAPHSIAATQTFWACGLLCWAARLTLRPRPPLHRTPLDYALLGFFILTFLSALFSYDPDVSIGKLRAASLFTIVYLFAENVRTRRTLRRLAFVLVASCMISVLYVFGARVIGQGVKLVSLAADSPLRAAGVQEGDTVLKVNGAPVSSVAGIAAALSGPPGAPPARLVIYRREFFYSFELPRAPGLAGATPEEQLGVRGWTRGRDQRASGFYGHYTTYAEVLQLIASLATGFFVALPGKATSAGALLAASSVGMSVALLLTVTRASWLAFLVSVGVLVLAGAASRRAVMAVLLAALLVAPVGLYVLRQKRQVGFFDRSDGSITWRETVYREGFNLLISKPRHLLVGVGMDSIKRHRREWGLFDHGRLPFGHMHSTPLQLALERGIPALLAWLALIGLYLRMLWRLVRRRGELDWAERGLALGALGGTIGFFTSGLVHYNLGDSEVAMAFYFVMGLALAVERLKREEVGGLA